MAETLRQALLELHDDYVAAAADGKFGVAESLHLVADGCEVLERAIKGVIGDDQAFNALVVDVEGFVQEYIVPIDLNKKFKVPAMMERFFIDPQLVPSVRPTMEAMRASLLPPS